MDASRDSQPALVCHKCGHPKPNARLGDRCERDGTALVPEVDHLKCLADPILGRVLGGKYPVIGFIGAGGMGAVYRALQEPVGREVAIKVIRATGEYGEDGQTAGAALRSRFLREAKVVAQLSNPSTVTLHDYGVEPDGVLFMVLELVKGVRLDRAIKDDGPFSPARAVSIARQILNALSEAHGLGLVHRDLKPDNIMLVKGPWGEEQAKVLDFGIAKVLDTENSAGAQDTRTGAVLGTPRYMAPEQATGQGEPRSDLYALAVVIFEMLSGHAPYVGKTPFETLMRHRTDPIPPLAADLNVPPRLEAVMRRALSKEADGRFEDAHEMAAALLDAVPLGSLAEMAAYGKNGPPRRGSRPSPAETRAASLDELEDDEGGATRGDASKETMEERPSRRSSKVEGPTVVARPPTRRPSPRDQEAREAAGTAVLDVLDAEDAESDDRKEDEDDRDRDEEEADREPEEQDSGTYKAVLIAGVLAVLIVAAGWLLYLTRGPEVVPERVVVPPPPVHVSAPPPRALAGPDAARELEAAAAADAGAGYAELDNNRPRPEPVGVGKPPAPIKRPPPPVKPGTKPKPGTKTGEAGYELEIF